MPAYNAEKTLIDTYNEIPLEFVDNLILVDDGSSDNTFALANRLGINTHRHLKNSGYGANQKTCYKLALERGADVVVMVHPDYQYTPKILISIVSLIVYDVYDVVLGSRIIGGGALSGGMPLYKFIFNRILTFIQNILMSQKISEYHTGYRAYSREVLESIPYQKNSNDFDFDNQLLTQVCFKNYRIGEVSCPTKYFEGASSINFIRSLKYGLKCILNSFLYKSAKYKIYTPNFLKIDK